MNGSTKRLHQEVSQVIAENGTAHEAEGMAFISTPFNSLIEDSLQDPSIGETSHFRWHATPVGIAALWTLNQQPTVPPFEQALKEGLEIGLDLSREEREFHQIENGLILVFHS